MTGKYSDVQFLRNLFIASAAVALLSAYPIAVYASSFQLFSIITGYFISLVIALIGFFLNKNAYEKSMKNFMVMVFGGIGIRMIITGILLVIALLFLKLDTVTLVSSVMFFYFLFISLEIHFLHRKTSEDKLNLNTTR